MVIPNYWMTHTKLANSTMIRIVSFAALLMLSKWRRSFSTRRSHLPPLPHQWLYDVDSTISMNGEITWCRFHAFLSMQQHWQFPPSAHCKLKSDRSLEAHSGRGGTARNHHGIPLNSHSKSSSTSHDPLQKQTMCFTMGVSNFIYRRKQFNSHWSSAAKC